MEESLLLTEESDHSHSQSGRSLEVDVTGGAGGGEGDEELPLPPLEYLKEITILHEYKLKSLAPNEKMFLE